MGSVIQHLPGIGTLVPTATTFMPLSAQTEVWVPKALGIGTSVPTATTFLPLSTQTEVWVPKPLGIGTLVPTVCF